MNAPSAVTPSPGLIIGREEWPDADFELDDGEPLNTLDAGSDREDDEEMDWDEEMDLGKTGGAKAKAVVAGIAARSERAMITIRPPLPSQEEEEEEEDEGVSTIKVAALPKLLFKPAAALAPPPVDEDIEAAFLLPSDLTQLSLAPSSLNHRSSKSSFEWGDKDQTYSSQSSDAYSTLGLHDIYPSSNSASSASLPETECEDDVEEEELEGLIIPTGLFESGQSGRQLKKILESKKKVQITDQHFQVASPDPEDDFEAGLVIEDDVDLSASRLLNAKQTRPLANRSKSMPARPPVSIRPPSRLKIDRAKSPSNPPPSSMRQLQKIKLSSSPPSQPVQSARAQTYKEVLTSPAPSPTTAFLSPKPASLRGQKSHSGLKPPTPPSTVGKQLLRKASLSSLMEASTSQASGSGLASIVAPVTKLSRYEAPTAASRAKSHTNSTSRIHAPEFIVPPTRPSTPSSNPAALRLTLPTTIRMKSRPALSSVFSAAANTATPAAQLRATSPLPPRPPSSMSLRARTATSSPVPSTTAPKLLRRPKRQRLYGDGTELDAFDDLPTDRDKEVRFRVQAKAPTRASASSCLAKPSEKDKGTIRKKGRIEALTSAQDISSALATTTNTLRRTGRIEFPTSKHGSAELLVKKRKDASSPVVDQTRRKPTLIRQLGGVSAPKVVGEMKWNPATLRWEGNDRALRDFDAAVGTSTRPALITHLTGSSIGSPVGSFASGARKVGNMIFDPTKMCWISTQEEHDVFADLADDEEDGDGWETKGGTIRASQQQSSTADADTSGSGSSSSSAVDAPSPARSHTRSMSECGSDREDRGSRASIVYDVDADFVDKCRAAEERHKVEMKAWRMVSTRSVDPFGDSDRSDLYEIRALATRRY